MKIYIFGAGASLGSQEPILSTDNPMRAPLIDELFEDRYSSFATYTLEKEKLEFFRKEISSREDKSLEKWLETQWNNIEKITPIQSRKSQKRLFGHVLFYLWNVMRWISASYNRENVYRKFLTNVQNQPDEFGIVSFNYDTLLDKAYQEVFNKTFISLNDYLEENFIKPHGSINWVLKPRKSDPLLPPVHDTRLRISMAMENFFMDDPIPMELDVLDPFLEPLREIDIARVWERLGYAYFYPLVFMPLAQKNLSHIDKFYEEVIKKARDMFLRADEIYIIGYRAQDMIIKELFRFIPNNTPLHVIANTKAIPISSEILGWANNLREGSKINGGFAAFNQAHFQNPLNKGEY